MKFYDRKKELAALSRVAALSRSASHMVVLTGRRRVGKTELIRQFAKGRSDVLYFFVSRKKPHVLLEEYRDVLAERIPMVKTASFRSAADFFTFLFTTMKQNHLIVVFDEFQNFEIVDPSVFSTVQNLWDREKDKIRGAFVFIGSVFTLMQRIFEGSKEPLFGRATSRIYLEPLAPGAVGGILADHGLDVASNLPFYFTLFGGIPKYYFLLDRYRLLRSPHGGIVRRLYCEKDAPLQNEGGELLIEEFGKNYHLYFSILQVIAGGETRMARIADGAGINVNSISKYLDELTAYYQVVERRVPVARRRVEKEKTGRYYLKDPALRFWFRYIFSSRTLLEIGDEERLLRKIMADLPTLMGTAFEELVRQLLTAGNDGRTLPFRFTRIGGFWSRKGETEIDIVAINEETDEALFGECKLKGAKVTAADARRLKEKSERVGWMKAKRKTHYALFSAQAVPEAHRQVLAREGLQVYDLADLLRRP